MRSPTPPDDTADAGNHSAPAAPAAPPPRRTFIVLMIVVTALLFAGMLSLLFYRWASMREPSSVLIVEGSPRFEGVEVTVEGLALRQPHNAKLTAERNFVMPFYLDRGFYTIRVSRDGRTLMQSEFEIGAREGKKLSLVNHENLLDAPATRPATAPR